MSVALNETLAPAGPAGTAPQDAAAGTAGSTRKDAAAGTAALARQVAADGYAFAPAARMAPLLEAAGLTDWAGFAASWDDLGMDTYMADGGRYRRRRFAVFNATPHGFARAPHQPHYQSRDYNMLNGGVARWFAPITEPIARHPALLAVLDRARALFETISPIRAWHVELHQFRIEARPDTPGQPSPEGMHRDGVDYVLVLLVGRQNVASGTTTIAAADRTPLGSFTLTTPMDAAWVDDWRVFHGVTPIRPVDPELPAHRDVLVVTFRQGG